MEKVPASVCAQAKDDAYLSMAVWEIHGAELMGPRGTDSRLHLHSGSHCAFEFRSQGACRVGVGWSGCARACMEPYLSLENPVCLARPCMGLPGSCLGPCTHAFNFQTILHHKTCCRWFCFVSVVHYADNSYQI